MPWHVAKSSNCPADRPWAVIKDADGSVVACHATESDANDQMKALYASENSLRERRALMHNSMMADHEPAWGDVDKTKLPRNAFADQGEADSKSTWAYPHHWVENGGGMNDMGCYTTGDMYLHKGGLNAAWAAANGARAGVEASAAVKAHLQAHRQALGMEENAYRYDARERRAFVVKELRVQQSGASLTIAGHAAVFNQLSEQLGFWDPFFERILPGAFLDSIGKDDVRSLFNHDTNFILGRTKSGTLRLREDEVGLAIENDLPDTQVGRDLAKSIARGDIDQMSFGFETITDYWQHESGKNIRSLVKVKLYDVSPVTFPAYPQTDVAMRSLERARRQAGAAEQKSSAIASPDISERRKFLEARTPQPDPLSLEEIIKRARKAQ